MKANEREKETAVFLLNLANDMRRFKGHTTLVDLPQSLTQNPDSCIIANAFNYGCNVDPDAGIISFENTKDRDTYMRVMGLNKDDYLWAVDLAEDDPRWETECVYYGFDAPMTDDLINIAYAFDNHQLFVEYSEFAEEEQLHEIE